MKEKIMLLLVGLSEYLQIPLSDDQLKMYAEDLMDLSLEEVSGAIKIFRATQKESFGRFPLPAFLKSLVRPEVDEMARARLVTANIINAIAKFGYTQPDKAQEFLGNFTWQVVQKSGGWKSLCSRTNDENISFIQAQIRDLACSLYSLNKNSENLELDHKKHYGELLDKISTNQVTK